jgi:GT2 family glycosyltransferase
VRVSAVVVSHGQAERTARCLAALLPEVDEAVVVANVPGSAPSPLPAGVRLLESPAPRGFAANANAGFAATSGDAVVLANPDAVARTGAVRTLAAFMAEHPRCGVAGPELRYPDGEWQPSRRRFPTVLGTIARRTPLRLVRDPKVHQRRHYMLDERTAEPGEADWLLGGFLLLRRAMLEELGGFDERFRMYGEDIDLAYRAAKAGWERWYVPAAVVEHDYAAVIDKRFLTRRTLWHLGGMIRFVCKHPERLRAVR